MSVAFGDFGAGYTVAERPDLRVLRDPFSAKPHVLFYATKRVGGDVSDFRGDQAAEIRDLPKRGADRAGAMCPRPGRAPPNLHALSSCSPPSEQRGWRAPEPPEGSGTIRSYSMMLIEETAVPDAALPVAQFKAHLRLGTGFCRR